MLDGGRTYVWGTTPPVNSRTVHYDGTVTTDANGIITLSWNLAPVMSALRGAPSFMAVTPGAGLTATLSDDLISAVKLRVWIASSPVVNQTFPVRITFFGVA